MDRDEQNYKKMIKQYHFKKIIATLMVILCVITFAVGYLLFQGTSFYPFNLLHEWGIKFYYLIILSLLFLSVYLFIWRCPNCKGFLPRLDFNLCPHCGFKYVNKQKRIHIHDELQYDQYYIDSVNAQSKKLKDLKNSKRNLIFKTFGFSLCISVPLFYILKPHLPRIAVFFILSIFILACTLEIPEIVMLIKSYKLSKCPKCKKEIPDFKLSIPNVCPYCGIILVELENEE